jgi:hypothetical protein
MPPLFCRHSAALLRSGHVAVWGWAELGQIGEVSDDGSRLEVPSPSVPVASSRDRHVAVLCLSRHHRPTMLSVVDDMLDSFMHMSPAVGFDQEQLMPRSCTLSLDATKQIEHHGLCVLNPQLLHTRHGVALQSVGVWCAFWHTLVLVRQSCVQAADRELC